MDKIGGHLMVGTNERGEVIINLNLDHDRTGHVVFSPNQARGLANLLLQKAIEADTSIGESTADAQQPVHPALNYPREMTEPVRQVLRLMCFKTSPIARAYRCGGHDIQTSVEEEQAFVLHRFLRLALEHGDKWDELATAEMIAVVEAGKARQEKQPRE